MALIGQWGECTTHELKRLDLFPVRLHWSPPAWDGSDGTNLWFLGSCSPPLALIKVRNSGFWVLDSRFWVLLSPGQISGCACVIRRFRGSTQQVDTCMQESPVPLAACRLWLSRLFPAVERKRSGPLLGHRTRKGRHFTCNCRQWSGAKCRWMWLRLW